MKLAQSRITAQGQVSVPAEVRRRLGLAPGSTIEWDEEGGAIVIRRARRYTSDEIHRALFPEGSPQTHSLADLKEGIRVRMRRRNARD
ncbi:MAG: AbrB/MazE/SpoVT family DNA-binding domain-containing protein [Deltaproteobacteria bacterium]|nr:AbrB/MazE/SpoVT family DNA-binding domain-containing protein [Deltaproteobacteria bacterium]